MRKVHVTLLLVFCTMLGAVPAAAAPSGRLVGKRYSGPAPGASTPRLIFDHDDCTIEEPAPGCVVARLRPRDRFVAVEVRDDVAGPLVFAVVTVESRDGHFDLVGEVCGTSMEVPFPIPKGYDYLEVHVLAGTCIGSATPSVVTSGDVDLWFTQRRFG